MKEGILETTVKGGRDAGMASREGHIRKTKPSLEIISLVTSLPHASLLSLEKYSLANMS